MDCKAAVKIGEYSRGGETRGDDKAADHDMGCTEKYTPFGILDENGGQLNVAFGGSAKTSDFIADCLRDWRDGMPSAEREEIPRLRIKAYNSPESSGRRIQLGAVPFVTYWFRFESVVNTVCWQWLRLFFLQEKIFFH